MKATTAPKSIRLDARVEWRLVLVVTLVAFGLRVHSPGSLGLTHFDEGVYALAGLWSVVPGGLVSLDPQVISYAPPGLPVLIGVAYLAFGVSDLAAIAVSVFAGVLTVPCLAWVARRTFGPGAGVASAVLVAGSVAHIAFSRKALTDAPYLLAWVASLGLGGRFLERPTLGRGLAFGVAAGLAQNFKYNGGMMLAVVALTALLDLALRTDSRSARQFLRRFGFGGVSVATAVLLYVPWFLFVERHGGYAALVRHHASYVGGTAVWWPHWRLQLAQVVAIAGSDQWRSVTWVLAGLTGWLAVGDLTWRQATRSPFVVRGVLAIGVLAAGASVCPDAGWWAGLVALIPLMRSAEPSRRLVGMSWAVFSILTPFYHPYARLWLPLHAAGWLILGGLITDLRPDRLSELLAGVPRVRSLASASGVLLLIVVSRTHWGNQVPRPFPVGVLRTPTDQFRSVVAAPTLSAPDPAAPPVTLSILARRPLLFYLMTRSPYPVRLLADEAALRRPAANAGDWRVVDEAVLPQGRRVDSTSSGMGHEWLSVGAFRATLDPVTLLDVAPETCFDADASRPYVVAVYKPRSVPSRGQIPASPTNLPDTTTKPTRP